MPGRWWWLTRPQAAVPIADRSGTIIRALERPEHGVFGASQEGRPPVDVTSNLIAGGPVIEMASRGCESVPLSLDRVESRLLVTEPQPRIRVGRAVEARCRPVACEPPARGRPRRLWAGWR